MTKHTSTQNTEVLADRTRVGKETLYIRGHSQEEIRRLIDQAGDPPVNHRAAAAKRGYGAGMRVLDLGCGAGEVRRLHQELVAQFRGRGERPLLKRGSASQRGRHSQWLYL